MRAGSKLVALATAGCLSALRAGSAALAAEINLVSTPGPMPEVLGALVPMFEHASGNKVTVKFQAGPQTLGQLKEGAGIDLLIADEEVIEDFVKIWFTGEALGDKRRFYFLPGGALRWL